MAGVAGADGGRGKGRRLKSVRTADPAAARVERLLEQRTRANERFFATEAGRLSELCHRMAERFARGGRLLALATSPQGRSDARHVAVEFVHPVIVGKRALPALGLASEGGGVAAQLSLLATAEDIVVAFTPGDVAELSDAVAAARGRGSLTVAFSELGAEYELDPATDDPFVAQELVETAYHVLWELVHVFLEHRGLLAGRGARPAHDAGASSFLYPFLAEQERDLGAVLADVRGSVAMKADDVAELRAATIAAAGSELVLAARALRAVFEGGGALLAFGNGGSATDAMDAVADFRSPLQPWPRRRALDLTEDAAILTALANDIGPGAMFTRQLIAYGRAGDAALALSTSGNSGSIIEGLVEARRRGLVTLAIVGYDGGRVAAERLADHVVVAPSEHIPRIQEAHATAYHVLRELVELEPAGESA